MVDSIFLGEKSQKEILDIVRLYNTKFWKDGDDIDMFLVVVYMF